MDTYSSSWCTKESRTYNPDYPLLTANSIQIKLAEVGTERSLATLFINWINKFHVGSHHAHYQRFRKEEATACLFGRSSEANLGRSRCRRWEAIYQTTMCRTSRKSVFKRLWWKTNSLEERTIWRWRMDQQQVRCQPGRNWWRRQWWW